jgi:hypothetical protein
MQDRQFAHFVHPVYFGSILCRRSRSFFRRHEVSLLPIHAKQIWDHLPRYGNCRRITASFLPSLVINHSHLIVLVSVPLDGFYQRTLNMSFRCFESSIRIALSAELRSSPQRPQ